MEYHGDLGVRKLIPSNTVIPEHCACFALESIVVEEAVGELKQRLVATEVVGELRQHSLVVASIPPPGVDPAEHEALEEGVGEAVLLSDRRVNDGTKLAGVAGKKKLTLATQKASDGGNCEGVDKQACCVS